MRLWGDGSRRWPAVLAGLVLLVGVSVSVGTGLVLHRDQRGVAGQQMDRRVTQIRDAVHTGSRRYVDMVQAVASAAGTAQPLTAEAFAGATAPLAGMGLVGATHISFLVPATDEQVAGVQATWRARGDPALTLKPGGAGTEHVFAVATRALDHSPGYLTGVDALTVPAPAAALLRSRRTGLASVSDTYHLVRDQQLPPAERQLSFVLTAPVYGPDRTFQGWVLLGLRGRDFIGGTLTKAAQNLLDVTLSATGVDTAVVPVAVLRSTRTGQRDLTRHVDVPVADRVWRLRIDAVGRNLPGAGSSVPMLAAGGGVGFSALLAGLVYVLATGRARAQRQVRSATAELAAAERDARRHAALLTAILDTISDGVSAVDDRGRFLLHNPAADEMVRTGPAEWQHYFGAFRMDGQTPFPTAELPLALAMNGQATDQVPMIIRTGDEPRDRVLSVSARPLDVPGVQGGAVAVFHDITARTAADREVALATEQLHDELSRRQRAEADLRAAHDAAAGQQAYLVQVLDALEVAVITCDPAGTIVHANRNARARTPAAEPGRRVADLVPAAMTGPDGGPLDPRDTPLYRSLRGERVGGVELRAVEDDGQARVAMLHSRPLYDVDGVIVGAVGTAYDISTLREREAELVAFAGVVAHDLKNPLASIAGLAALLREELDAAPDVRPDPDLVDRIIATTDRMRGLIEDLLSYASSRDGAIAGVDLDLELLVEDVVSDRTAGWAVTGSGPAAQVLVESLPHVWADRAMIRQLVDNLVGNALKYTPPGQPARIDITATPAAHGWVRVDVADRGIGIPEGQHQAIFTDFHRAHATADYAGTGLGLAICHRIVTRHGGTIGVDDNPGGGARFWFTLPTTAASSVAKVAARPGAAR